MIPKAIAEIVQADIDVLVASAVSEGNQLDFKQSLVGMGRDDRKEFIADICSFANTRGGDFVFGIQEDDEGRAQAVLPQAFNPDDEILRLENMIADSIEPRLFGVRMHAVEHGTGRVLVIRVPKSVQGIHRNKLDERFWIRESRSKRPLDVAGLASRFQGLAHRQDRLVEFLAERYAAIATRQLPLPMQQGPCVVTHIFPLHASIDQVIDVTPVAEVMALPLPRRASGSEFRMTFEGPMQHSAVTNGTIRAYTLTHHSGVIEGVCLVAEPSQFIGAEAVEATILQFVRQAVPRALDRLSLDYPLVVRSAIVSGQGRVVRSVSADVRFHYEDGVLCPILRTALVLPDTILSSHSDDLPQLLKPAFDRLWQASGYARSFTYQDRDGMQVWAGTV